MSLGARIRAARVAAGMSQRLAAGMGMRPADLFDPDSPFPVGDAKPLWGAMAVAADRQRIRSPVVRRRRAALVTAVAEGTEAEDGEPEGDGEG